MCGIFGWIPSNAFCKNDARATCQALCAALQHRGPNDSGFTVFDANRAFSEYTEKSSSMPDSTRLLLGQTRLSILDTTPAGHQPMRSDDGRYTIVYNGEVYNYKELRSEMEKQGERFHTNSDTEVVLRALILYGVDALARFIGMFALAFFDAQNNTLTLARDFFGIKPLFWHRGENGLCFASELPALLHFPKISRRVSPFAAYQFLCFGRYDMGSSTMLEGTHSLPPAHYLQIDLNNVAASTPICYWRPEINNISTLSFSDAAECIREIFLDSVKLHLRSDVPLGIALSGGIDSSATVCAVRHLEPDADIHTFSYIAPGTDISEDYWAEKVAKKTSCIRHVVSVNSNELLNDLDSMIIAQGEPFRSTSIYAQYRVFKLAKDCGVTVTLDGQGADEIFAGYHGYPGQRLSSLLRSGHFIKAWQFFQATSAWPGRSKKGVLERTIGEFVPDWLMQHALVAVGQSPRPEWLDIDAFRGLNLSLLPYNIKGELYPSPSKVKQLLAYQLTWQGLPELLRHGDRNAMAHSIESRVPFLTKNMAEFCLSLPEEYLVDMQGRSKSVFREAMRGLVPDDVLDRRDKIGFATPEALWLKELSPWIEETIQGAYGIPFLKTDFLLRFWHEVLEGQRAFDWRVWCMICYIRWTQLFKISY